MLTHSPDVYARLTDDALLAVLSDERSKFTQADDKAMKVMIDELVRRGVYPSQEGKTNDVYSMVSGWGAYWHQWTGPMNCPSCNADLRDHKNGPPFKREIGLYDQGRDRTVALRCPDCSVTWARI